MNYTKWTFSSNGHGGYVIHREGRRIPYQGAHIVTRTDGQAANLCKVLNAAEVLAELNAPAQIAAGSLVEETAHDDAIRTLRGELKNL